MSRILFGSPAALAIGWLIALAGGSSIPRSVEFPFWPSSSAFVLAGDEQGLLFSENGPDGIVLKKADLRTGKLSTVRPLAGADYRFAAIPGNRTQIVAAAQCCFSKSPSEIWLLRLSGAGDVKLDVGENGSDGNLVVSPSGRFLATGTDYVCFGGDRDCFPRAVSVLTLTDAVAEFSVPVDSVEEKQPNPLGDKFPPEVRRRSTLHTIGWAAEDVLVIRTYDSLPQAFRRIGAGRWAPTSPSVALALLPSERVYSPSIALSTGSGDILGSAVVESLFDARPGTVWILRGRNRVVLLKTFPPRDRSTKYFSAVAYVFDGAKQ